MGLIVYDSDVLIGYLNGGDAHHPRSVACLVAEARAGTRGLVSAVSLAEVLVGPTRIGAQARVHAAIGTLGFEVVPVTVGVAGRAAEVRGRTALKLPDAIVLATALEARAGLASFDERLLRAHAELAA